MKNGFVKSYIAETKGNMSLLVGGAIMTLMIGIGVAYDFSAMVNARAKLQDSVDTASLAGASIARKSESKIKQYARDTLNSNSSLLKGMKITSSSVIVDTANKEITVKATADYNAAFMSMFSDNLQVSASSTTSFSIEQMDPFSVFLVLDTSGSMGWLSADGRVKMDALKTAVEDLFTALYNASENPALLQNTIRTGYSSYNLNLQASLPLTYGYNSTINYTKSMIANGGTNSTPAFQYAYDQMNMEAASQPNNWSGYILFMTDGDNNDPAYDTDTLALCSSAKTKGYKIYTVAFEAPQKGKDLLLVCASTPNDAFTSDNASALSAAFEAIGRDISKQVIRIKR